MAFIILHSGKAITMSHKQAVSLKAVKEGTILGSDQQKAFAKRVKKIYLGKQYEPVVKTPEATKQWWDV